MKKGLVVLALCLLMLGGCSQEQKLELYILPAERVSQDTMTDSDIGKVALLEGRLAFTGQDFNGVDWEKQLFSVKPEASSSVSVITAQSGGCSLLKTTDADLFVWVLDGKALYVGGFERGSGAVTSQRDPYIRDHERYIFEIVSSAQQDKRYNSKLYNYFYSHDLIKSELN